jgi:hypothetical protein
MSAGVAENEPIEIRVLLEMLDARRPAGAPRR